MISKQQVDTAISSAKLAIQQDAVLSWVTHSALMERAYFAGLFEGLRGIANEDDLRMLALETITNTMSARTGDDSFLSTALGKAFNEFKESILGPDEHSQSPPSTNALEEGINEVNHHWVSVIQDSETLVSELRESIENSPSQENASAHEARAELRDRFCRIVEHLEYCIRFLSLAQKDHRRRRTLED